MKAREGIYYLVSSTLGRFLRYGSVISFFAFFTLQRSDNRVRFSQILPWLRRWGILLALSTIFMLLVVNGIWSAANHRLTPDGQPNTRWFLEDWPNLFNYIIIGPIYIVFGLAFLFYIPYLRSDLNANGCFNVIGLTSFRRREFGNRYIWAPLIIIIVNSIIIFWYSKELTGYSWQFWFQHMAGSSLFSSGAHGYYYLITNFLLCLIAIVLIAAHFETFTIAALIGREIQNKLKTNDPIDPSLLNQDTIKQLFSPIASFYTLSKILALAYIANMYTWRAQNPQFLGLLEISIVVVAVLAAALISYPRYHIQYWLFRLWQENAKQDYPEIRRPLQIAIAGAADVVILGSAMTKLIAFILNKSGVSLRII